MSNTQIILGGTDYSGISGSRITERLAPAALPTVEADVDDPRQTDAWVLGKLVEFRVLHDARPTTHTRIMVMVLETEARMRGLEVA